MFTFLQLDVHAHEDLARNSCKDTLFGGGSLKDTQSVGHSAEVHFFEKWVRRNLILIMRIHFQKLRHSMPRLNKIFYELLFIFILHVHVSTVLPAHVHIHQNKVHSRVSSNFTQE